MEQTQKEPLPELEATELSQVDSKLMEMSIAEIEAARDEILKLIKIAEDDLHNLKEDQLTDFNTFKEKSDKLNNLLTKKKELDTVFMYKKDERELAGGKGLKLNALPEDPLRTVPLDIAQTLEYKTIDEIKEMLKNKELQLYEVKNTLKVLRNEKLNMTGELNDQDKQKFEYLTANIKKLEEILDENEEIKTLDKKTGSEEKGNEKKKGVLRGFLSSFFGKK